MLSSIKRIILLFFFVCICGAGAVHLFDPDFAGHAFRGSIADEKVYEEGERLYVQKNCHSCHGEKGAAPILSNYPRVAGQNQEYLYNQMVQVVKTYFGVHNSVTLRSMKRYNKENFQASLLATDWDPVLSCDNVSEAWNIFKNVFTSVIDNIAPVKQVRLKQRTEPWMDSDILQAINERDRAFHRYKVEKSDTNYDTFKCLRNKVQSLVHGAKKNYYKSTLEENKNNSKSLWKSLKSMGLPSKKCSSVPSPNICLKINDNICFEKKSIAETFNSFYTTVASDLVKKLPKCVHKYGCGFVNSFYSSKGVLPENYSFTIVSESKVLKYLNSLGIKKATGLDGIPSRFVRDGSTIIAGPLTHVINLSLIQGVVPDDLKCARVVPLYKKNDRLCVGNYILNIISKVLERVVYDQVESYFKDKDLLYKYQSGFRGGYSTDTCLIHLSDFIRMENDKGNVVGMVLLDLQKAFDTVDHTILLMKLKASGLGNDITRWFNSYLSDRQQLVDVSGTFSSSKNISCGVPQGSILGPLLFLIYVNDMSAVVKNKLLLYADDSAILVSDKNIATVEEILSDDLQIVSEWLVDNKLSLHLGKTESILFGTRQKLRSHTGLNISCNGTPISSTTSVKYLGITIDQHLSFTSMAESIIKKANARLKFLYRKKEFLTMHTRRLLVMSLVQCHFDFACSVWYTGLTQKLKDKLQVTQNKLIRFILNLHPRSHIGKEHFNKLSWLPVESRVNQISLCHVFKISSNVAPSYLCDGFTPANNVHSKATRFRVRVQSNPADTGQNMIDCKRYTIPRVKGSGQKSFAYHGCTLWNSLPQHFRDMKSISSFKYSLKEHLLSQIDF